MSSGARPRASTRGWKTVRQPALCSRSVVCASSTTVSVATPPTETRASRRMTVGHPHQKAALWRSFPRQMMSKKMLWSLRRGSSSERGCPKPRL